MIFTNFLFSTDVVDRVIEEIDKAGSYLRIAVFQIHRKTVFDSIKKALKRGVKVEILTLPYDSINDDIRQRVSQNIEDIKANGATIYLSKWNIGDPARTTTAVGRWYSYHGKFLTTEKIAISLSANMIDEEELDAMLLFDSEEKILEFNKKFEELVRLFGDSGIRELVNRNYKGSVDLFSAPKTITNDEIRNHWLVDYPASICPTDIELKSSLYIAPFDCQARSFYTKVMVEAERYIYISTESFTDTDIIPSLISQTVKGKLLKILTGSNTQDFNDRIRKYYPQLMANEIEMRKPSSSLHAKLLITDKRLVVSSVNLNKINLGYARTKSYWRANTETITMVSDPFMIESATSLFEKTFNAAQSILDYFVIKEEAFAKSIFEVYGVKADRTVRRMFASVIVRSDVKAKKNLYDIGKYASIIYKKFGRGRSSIDASDFLCAMVLYYLTERKHTQSEIEEKLTEIQTEISTFKILNNLRFYGLVEEEGDFFKINILELLGE